MRFKFRRFYNATIFPYTGVSLDPHMSALGYTYTPVLTFETPDPIAGANEDSYVSALQPQIVPMIIKYLEMVLGLARRLTRHWVHFLANLVSLSLDQAPSQKVFLLSSWLIDVEIPPQLVLRKHLLRLQSLAARCLP